MVGQTGRTPSRRRWTSRSPLARHRDRSYLDRLPARFSHRVGVCQICGNSRIDTGQAKLAFSTTLALGCPSSLGYRRIIFPAAGTFYSTYRRMPARIAAPLLSFSLVTYPTRRRVHVIPRIGTAMSAGTGYYAFVTLLNLHLRAFFAPIARPGHLVVEFANTRPMARPRSGRAIVIARGASPESNRMWARRCPP
jgi:hypothetical protein